MGKGAIIIAAKKSLNQNIESICKSILIIVTK
jgi:hypothetical protein